MTVTVRFAPSPTGFIHLGGLRTALYNYLFAKQNKGTFILRIEDTDRNRLVKDSMQSIIDILKWCKIFPDYGPFNECDYSKYIQSHRLDIYKSIAYQLFEEGKAYRCFCTPTRLELMRKEAAKNRLKIGYDSRCKYLSNTEIEEKLRQKIPFTIRFKLDTGNIIFNDMVYKNISTNMEESESDFVILKSDSYPTYHLANVVDDHLMNITHVLRGTEWLHSTPKHIMLYNALGWKHPEFAHLPLLLNADLSKLSKRNDNMRVNFLKNQGYHPEAILNFLATSAGGFNSSPKSIRNLEELIQDFNLAEVGCISRKLDAEKLNAFNRAILRLKYKKDKNKVMFELRAFLKEKCGEQVSKKYEDGYLKLILEWSLPRISCFAELFDELNYVWNPIEYAFDIEEFNCLGNLELVIEECINMINNVVMPSESIGEKPNLNCLKKYCEDNNKEYSKLMKLLRLSLINNEHGPPIAELLMVLRKEEFVKRLREAINYIKQKKIIS